MVLSDGECLVRTVAIGELRRSAWTTSGSQPISSGSPNPHHARKSSWEFSRMYLISPCSIPFRYGGISSGTTSNIAPVQPVRTQGRPRFHCG